MAEPEGAIEEVEVEGIEDVEVEGIEDVEAETEEAPEAVGEETEETEVEAQESEEETKQPPEESEVEPERRPFSFRVDQRVVDVPGAYEVSRTVDGSTVDEIVIPRDAWMRVVSNFADRTVWQRKEQALKNQLESFKPESHETVIRAQSILDGLEDALSSEEAFNNFVANFDTNKELLRLRADNAARDAQIKSKDARYETERSEQDWERSSHQIAADIPEIIRVGAREIAAAHKIEVSEAAIQAAEEQIRDNWSLYYFRADEDTAKRAGVEPGEYVRDNERVGATILRFARLAGPSKAEAVERANAEALADPKPKPKTVPAKGSPPSVEKDEPFKSREDFLRWGGANV